MRAIKREVREKVAGLPSIQPGEPVPYGTIGTALGCRVAFYFPPARSRLGDAALSLSGESGIRGLTARAQAGAGALAAAGILSRELAGVFFDDLHEKLQQLSPARRKLALEEEEHLCRYCFVLALFEEVTRIGMSRSLVDRSLEWVDVSQLLATPSNPTVEDIRAMSWRFYETQADLLLNDQAILNPTFDGSSDVGGADADVIVDGRLIEIKTALNPARIKKDSWPWQLLAYALLDYSNKFEIHTLDLYLARQGALIEWPADVFATTLTGQDVSLEVARLELRAALRLPA